MKSWCGRQGCGEGKCYTFEINDSYGDGICCVEGEGYFRGVLNEDNDNPLFEGGEFGFYNSTRFCFDGVTVTTDDDMVTGEDGPKLQIFLKTNSFGYETTWSLTDSDSGYVLGYDTYSENDESQVYVYLSENHFFYLQEGKCYTFEINDSEDNGICCGYGEGYYRGVLNGDNDNPLFEGGEFGAFRSMSFCTDGSTVLVVFVSRV